MRNFNTLLNLIKYIYISEKSLSKLPNKQYTFIVDKSLSKSEIKYLFNNFFNLDVKKINLLNLPNNTKKIYIQFKNDISLIKFLNLNNYLI